MLKPFLYNSLFINKLIKLILKKGLKEKIENKVLVLLKKFDYFIIFEIIYNLALPFKFFFLKKRIGRHSYVRKRVVSYILVEEQLFKGLSSFFDKVKSNHFSYKIISNYLNSFISSQSKITLPESLLLKKQVIFFKKMHHFRW